MATLFSVATSCLYFIISPVNEGHSELLARTSPTIYDVFIALFGGAAGILATGSRVKGNVLPGVASSHGSYAAAVYGRLRSGHVAVQLFYRSALSLFHQLGLYRLRDNNRYQADEVSSKGFLESGACQTCQEYRLHDCCPDDDTGMFHDLLDVYAVDVHHKLRQVCQH